MKNRVHKSIESHFDLKPIILNKAQLIHQAFEKIKHSLVNNNKIIFCGNGGSAADSQHLAAEFVGRFKKERTSLPAISLATDTSALTAIGNDYGFENIFSRQLESIGCSGDVIIGISTSGNSKNIIKALTLAKKKNIFSISFTGYDGGEIKKISDININIDINSTARIQEMHILIGHILCELIDEVY